ncbi:hypothetical protein C8J55DRAFT_490795 [Lentinula edodes]|uniref:Uncharacterized protein n=1 Tax=Lentinula lateritia TaxID=40482 RepID=A0A9W9A5U2_9AGAR|nr:hypothetical protein C8J55DRAFT_490795 [Lentinula edodes]
MTNDRAYSGAPVAGVSSDSTPSSHDIVALSSSVSPSTQETAPYNQSQDPAIVDHGMKPETLEEELHIRLAALQDTDSRLDFVQQPSSEQSFIFPDPETILKVNCGPFTLSPMHPQNRRFLETEARFCFLLRKLHEDHFDISEFGPIKILLSGLP